MNYDLFTEIITKKFPSLTNKKLQQFKEAETCYAEWNGKINVISRKDIAFFYSHHLLHSLSVAAYAGDRLAGKQILDIGTGGGFPGIPLAIFYPDSQFTLCDSVGKKTRVARAVAESLGLDNVTVVNARAESLPQKFDYAVSRAVAPAETLLGGVRGKYNGSLLCLKGGDINPEIAAAAGRWRIPQGGIRSWHINSWFQASDFGEADEQERTWFKEKYILEFPKI